jgi:MFS family permease
MNRGAPVTESTPLLRVRAFRPLFLTRIVSNTANQMQAVAVGWQIYDLTGSALYLGLIGLIQFLPPVGFSLVAGQVSDRYDRRLILRCCYTVEACVSLGLLTLTNLHQPPVAAFFILLLMNGIARTFEGPSLQSLIPALVPRAVLGRAIAANSSASKIAQLTGPSLGGFLYTVGPNLIYGCCVALVCAAVVASAILPKPPAPSVRPKITWTTVFAGIAFIWKTQAILGAMSLDLAAVLFGGATALLPIFARDILDIGPWGFGLLRSSPALGGLLAAAILSRYPVTRAGGRVMFAGVFLYGCATVLFGVSRIELLSIPMLMLVGFGDMYSAVIRQTLIQTRTPDDMRGRVSAVNMLFVNTASQLGAFESGITADWFGAVGSVVVGGSAVLGIVALWIWRFPALRRIEHPALPNDSRLSAVGMA